jgi:hypothetical protein
MKKFYLLLLLCLNLAIMAYAKSYVTTQDINIREGAGTEYTVLGKLKKGSTVDVIEVTGVWGKISYQNKEGYVSAKFLDEVSEKSSVLPDDKNKGSNSSTILIVVVLVILLFVFRKSPVLRYFAPVLTNLVSSSNRQNTSNSSSRTTQRSIPIFWFGCEKCGTTIESAKTPNTLGCPSDQHKFHRWNKLAESGEINYQCDKCGTLINSTKQPSTLGCPSDQHKFHRWNKL